MEKNNKMMKMLPLLLIVIGFLTLDMFQGYVALACMVTGIVMIIEKIWPEQWESDKSQKQEI